MMTDLESGSKKRVGPLKRKKDHHQKRMIKRKKKRRVGCPKRKKVEDPHPE